MRAFQIQDVKGFMSHLLLSTTFDRFLLAEASITTFNTFFIDGHLHKDYFSYDEEEQETAELCTYSFWEQLRPFALSLIKGKKTPLAMKIVFALAPKNVEKLTSRTIFHSGRKRSEVSFSTFSTMVRSLPSPPVFR